MEDIFKWVDDNIKWLTIAITGKNGRTMAEVFNARAKNIDGTPIAEAKHYIDALLKTLVATDDGCRRFIFRHIFSTGLTLYMLRPFVNPLNIEIDPSIKDNITPYEAEEYRKILSTIVIDLDEFYYWVRRYCQEWGNDIKEILKVCDSEGYIYEELHKYYEGCLPQRQEGQPKYKQLERSHRIAAVKMLLDSTGVSKGIDKTKIAAFVEAVTGGNIEAKPQDTISYKSPTNPAKEAAAVWLAKIGVK